MREADGAVSGAGVDGVATPVALERVARAVVLPTVGLEEHAGAREVEIDLEAGPRAGPRHVAGVASSSMPTDQAASDQDVPRGTPRRGNGRALRGDGVDVQAHVVDRRALAEAGEDRVEERLVQVGREALEVGAEVDRAQVLARVVGVDRALGEPAADVGEAGVLQAPLGLLRRAEVPRPVPALEVRAERRVFAGLARRRVDERDVAGAAALRDEAAAGSQRAAQGPEERIVVGDPVERRGGEDDVDGLPAEVEPDEVGDAQVGAVAEALASGLDHRRRQVDGDHAALGQPLEEQLGEAGGPAARVEERLVAAQLQALQHLAAEALHRSRQAVVLGAVPGSCLGHGRTLSRTDVRRGGYDLRPGSRALRRPQRPPFRPPGGGDDGSAAPAVSPGGAWRGRPPGGGGGPVEGGGCVPPAPPAVGTSPPGPPGGGGGVVPASGGGAGAAGPGSSSAPGGVVRASGGGAGAGGPVASLSAPGGAAPALAASTAAPPADASAASAAGG